MVLSSDHSCFHILNQHLQLFVICLSYLSELLLTLEYYFNLTLVVLALLQVRG